LIKSCPAFYREKGEKEGKKGGNLFDIETDGITRTLTSNGRRKKEGTDNHTGSAEFFSNRKGARCLTKKRKHESPIGLRRKREKKKERAPHP